MDRRSWPWKKKSSDTKADFSELSPQSARSHREQVPRGSSAENGRPVDDSGLNRQLYEEKIRHLNEKLSVAIAEITSKDNLAKQHAKVAEEAVSGWEKAETEAAKLKKQLEAAAQQRSGLEDRVAHLDGALKECMRELRHVREEQEHKLHESFTKKTREWDRVRVDLEAKLSSANDKLIEFEAHKSALSRSLQERAKTISELSDAKARAEAATTVIQVQKEEAEKKCTALKYEVQVLSKEVEIRNEEKDYNKKIADTVSKQQLENAKKVAKLEAECQRLRGLLRKKLPGPAAFAQMKLEVDGQGREHLDGKGRKSIGRSVSALAASVNSLEEVSQVDEGDALSERLLTMEEETKMLKEALAKKNEELQSARLMCARTASKLSNVEEQLEVLSRAQGNGNTGVVTTGSKLTSPTHDNCNGDERTSADSWASALVTQLEQFRKGNAGSNSDKLFESSNFDLMDDFVEMERLASTSSEQAASDKSSAASEIGVPVHDERVSFEEALSRKERECFELKKMCAELKKKLASADEQIRFLEHKNNGNETTSASSLGGITDMDKILAEARDRYALRKTKDSTLSHQDSLATFDSKNGLTSAMSKLIRLVESLAQEAGAHHGLTSSQTSPPPSHECNIIDGQVVAGMQWNNLDLDIGIKKLVFASNNLLQGKGDVLDFIAELSAVLGLLKSLGNSLNVEVFTGQSYNRSSGDWNECGQSAVFTAGDVGSMHKAENPGSKRFSFFGNDNAPKFSASLDESEGDTEFNSYAALEDDIAKLKAEKGNLEHKIHLADEKIERLKVQLSDSEQLVSNLRVQLASTEESKQLAEHELAAMATIKAELESKVRASGSLQDKIAAMESELQDQRARHEEVLSSLQKQIAQGASGSMESPHQLSEEATRLQKEREIAVAAEKLAECQRTIAVLGKQLQSLALPTGSARGSIDMSEVSMSPGDKNHRLDEPFSLKNEMLHSESEDEDAVQWTIDRTTSDRFHSRNARENIRKQEIYWSSASSAEANHDNWTEAASSRRSSMDGEFFANSPLEGRSSTYSKHGNSGFSRFFSRGKSSH